MIRYLREPWLRLRPRYGREKNHIDIGYLLPGVLNDCTPNPNMYPPEFNGRGWGIAGFMVGPFGVATQFDTDPGAVFERSPAGWIARFRLFNGVN